MARTKQLNMGAILKAYEAEAKRAERHAKAMRGDPISEYWAQHACKVRQHKQQAQGEQQ
jgi:hypothetical protein